MKNYNKQTQEFSTFGDKLLRHLDVLEKLQNKKEWRPITVQLSPTGKCEFNCDMCSVKNRDKKLELDYDLAIKGLEDFKKLGAKALELTGGGNPLLYPKLNELIQEASIMGYDIGIISNSLNPSKWLTKESFERIKWYRASLSGYDNFKDPIYNFDSVPKGKLGFSYIINNHTTKNTLERIVGLVKRYPDVKFVRIAPNCLLKEDIINFNDKWGKTIEKLGDKFFIKDVSSNFTAYPDFCGVGLVRPYCTEDGNVYMCSSYVLRKRKYEEKYKIGHLSDVNNIYNIANYNQGKFGKPYDIDIKDCYHCFYANNNKLLHTIVKEMNDENFA